MLTMYNLVTESNYKDVINKMTEKGYPMINEELPFLDNNLERDHVVTNTFVQEWGSTITSVR